MELVRDIFNYVGNKYRLLPEILKLIDSADRKIFVDVFGGGGTVTVNQPYNNVIYNDKLKQLSKLIKWIKDDEDSLNKVLAVIEKYRLTKTSKDEYYKLRDVYNSLEDKSSSEAHAILYALITHGFNYIVGFNQKGEFNVASGAGRSHFNRALQERYGQYVQRMRSKNIVITSLSFEKLIDKVVSKWDSNKVLFYLDPPYLASINTYERTKDVAWTEELEKLLYQSLKELDSKGYRWILSNVLYNNGKDNEYLKNFTKGFSVTLLECNYNNCNYQKDRTVLNQEVLVRNF